MATECTSTRLLSRADLGAFLKSINYPADPESILNGTAGLVANGVKYFLATPARIREAEADSHLDAVETRGRAADPRPAISDEEADRRIAEFEARRKVAPAPVAAPTPASAPSVTETHRAEPASPERGSLDFLDEVTRRMSLTDEERWKEDDWAIMRGSLDPNPHSTPLIDTRGAASPDDASTAFIELCMRGVNDSASVAERVSRDPSDELVRLAFQNVPDFDGPEAA